MQSHTGAGDSITYQHLDRSNSTFTVTGLLATGDMHYQHTRVGRPVLHRRVDLPANRE